MSDPKIEIKNKDHILAPTETNDDGSPVKEVLVDGKAVADIKNADHIIAPTEKNDDGTPVKVVTPTK
jgi:hypothetical protein